MTQNPVQVKAVSQTDNDELENREEIDFAENAVPLLVHNGLDRQLFESWRTLDTVSRVGALIKHDDGVMCGLSAAHELGLC